MLARDVGSDAMYRGKDWDWEEAKSTSHRVTNGGRSEQRDYSRKGTGRNKGQVVGKLFCLTHVSNTPSPSCFAFVLSDLNIFGVADSTTVQKIENYVS